MFWLCSILHLVEIWMLHFDYLLLHLILPLCHNKVFFISFFKNSVCCWNGHSLLAFKLSNSCNNFITWHVMWCRQLPIALCVKGNCLHLIYNLLVWTSHINFKILLSSLLLRNRIHSTWLIKYSQCENSTLGFPGYLQELAARYTPSTTLVQLAENITTYHQSHWCLDV